MHVSPTNTLAEIVSSNPQAAIVFEKYRLDFCCKGKRTLVEACQEKSIQPAKILYELQSTIEERANDGPISSFETNSLSELIKYIQEKHHLFTKNELSRLMVYLEKIADKHGTRHRTCKDTTTFWVIENRIIKSFSHRRRRTISSNNSVGTLFNYCRISHYYKY